MTPNPNNYCSMEIAHRLHEAGIVLETDQYYRVQDGNSTLQSSTDMKISSDPYHPDRDDDVIYGKAIFLPAPSMEEVWRELPNETVLERVGQKTMAYVSYIKGQAINARPTDALCELLIWVKGQNDG